MLYCTSQENWTLSIFREISYFITNKPFIGYYGDKYSNFPVLDEETEKLVILLHCMNSSPGQFMNHFDYFESLKDNTSKLYSPYILKKGQESLDKCSDEILKQIGGHIEIINNRKIKLVFVGISNGGRISVDILNKLYDKYPNISYYLTTLGSPFYRTSPIDSCVSLKIFDIKKYPYSELSFMNNNSWTPLMQKFTDTSSGKNRSLLFLTKNDLVVFPNIVSIINGDNNIGTEGCGHTSLILDKHKEQIDWIVKFNFIIIIKLNFCVKKCNERCILRRIIR